MRALALLQGWWPPSFPSTHGSTVSPRSCGCHGMVCPDVRIHPGHNQAVNLPDPSQNAWEKHSCIPALSLGKAQEQVTTGKQICRPLEPAAGTEKSLFLPGCLLAWLQAQPGSCVGHPCARCQLSLCPCWRSGGDALAEEHGTVSAGKCIAQPTPPLVFLFPVDVF